MKSIFCAFLFFILIQILCPNPANGGAQQRRQEERPFTPPLVYYEVANLISEKPGKSRIDINYKISNDFLIFVKTSVSSDTFTAKGEISAELINVDGVSIVRDVKHMELSRNREVATEEQRHQTAEGNFSFLVPPGEYTILFEALDEESRRHFFDRDKKIFAKNFQLNSLVFSDILSLDHMGITRDSTLRLFPVNLGGDVYFNKHFLIYAEVINPFPNPLTIRVDLRKRRTEQSEKIVVLSDTLQSKHLFMKKTLQIANDKNSFFLELKGSPLEKKYSLIIPINSDTLEQEAYEVQITATSGTNTATVTKHFSIRWIDMPRSLHNLFFAIDAMEYLLTKDEFSNLKNSSEAEQWKKFKEFWKKKDPTPKTAYNEAMAEYYRRVDYTVSNFATIGQENGLKTDRGKIYVLYGPPTKNERLFSPNSPPHEIWYYENIGKKFIFKDESRTGLYKLEAIEQL